MLSDLTILMNISFKAFNEMESKAFEANSDTTEFNERQFVFSIGQNLYLSNEWISFEYKYPHNSSTRCDIVIYKLRDAIEYWNWIEIKSTGLDVNGNWQNGFGNLNWENDFDKLGTLRNSRTSKHMRFWIWLYQFENYKEKLKFYHKQPSTLNEWKKPIGLNEMSALFGNPAKNKCNLPKLLNIIKNNSIAAYASIKPLVKSARKIKYSALIVTAKL